MVIFLKCKPDHIAPPPCVKPLDASTEECIKEMWYIYTMDTYSAIKNNETMLFATTWMDIEVIILSKSDRKTNI